MSIHEKINRKSWMMPGLRIKMVGRVKDSQKGISSDQPIFPEHTYWGEGIGKKLNFRAKL